MAKNTKANDKLTFNIINVSNFTDYLKKFIVVDSNALLELRTDNTILIKSFTAARTAIKIGSLSLEDIFDFDPATDSIKDNIKIGIYFIDTLIKMLAIVSADNSDTFIDIIYEKDSDDEYTANSINVYNKELTYNFTCAEKKLFRYMSDDSVKGVFDITDSKFEFELDTFSLKKLELITSVEKGSDIEIKLSGDQDDYELFFVTKNSKWKCDSEVVVNEANSSIIINKEYLKYIDKENYKVYSLDSKIIFQSQDTDSKLSFGTSISKDDE